MDRLKLIKPTLEYKEKSWEFRNECLSESEEIHGDGGLDKSNNFEEWLENLKKEYDNHKTIQINNPIH